MAKQRLGLAQVTCDLFSVHNFVPLLLIYGKQRLELAQVTCMLFSVHNFVSYGQAKTGNWNQVAELKALF